MNCIIHLTLFGVVSCCLLANNCLAKPEKAIVWLLRYENHVPREVQCIHPAITCCVFRFRRGTEIGNGGPLLAAKISPGGLVLVGDQNFCYRPDLRGLAVSSAAYTPWSKALRQGNY